MAEPLGDLAADPPHQFHGRVAQPVEVLGQGLAAEDADAERPFDVLEGESLRCSSSARWQSIQGTNRFAFGTWVTATVKWVSPRSISAIFAST